MPDNPQKQPSDEVDVNHQQSKTEGEAYQTSVSYMAHTVANDGGTTTAGEYVLGYAQEGAEGCTDSRARASSSSSNRTRRTATSKSSWPTPRTSGSSPTATCP
jgi:hypothetical protein